MSAESAFVKASDAIDVYFYAALVTIATSHLHGNNAKT